jgi:hypothetical protein
VTLLVTIAAPEQGGLDYEAESYSITRALHDHVGVVVNEMGELDDLVTGLRGEPPPHGVHFSGHGGRGQLVFEDEFGGPRTVLVEDMLNAIRREAPDRLPRFFYLACCHGGDAPVLSGDRASMQSGLLRDESRLTRTQEDWITQFERALQVPSAPPSPRGMGCLLSYGHALLRRLTYKQQRRQ